MDWFYIVMAITGGIFLPVQAGLNADLAVKLGSAQLAAMVSFLVGFMALTLYAMGARVSLPTSDAVASVPWWMWLGGLAGAYIVFASILVGPKIGAVQMLAFIVAGQMVSALVIDHFGLLSFPTQTLTWGRTVGAGLLVLGVVLIRKF